MKKVLQNVLRCVIIRRFLIVKIFKWYGVLYNCSNTIIHNNIPYEFNYLFKLILILLFTQHKS